MAKKIVLGPGDPIPKVPEGVCYTDWVKYLELECWDEEIDIHFESVPDKDVDPSDRRLKAKNAFLKNHPWLDKRIIAQNVRRLQRQRDIGKLVYFAICEGFCKIGYSSEPRKRVLGIQSNCPFEVRLLVAIVGGRTKERELHERFKDYKSRGEWFRFEGELQEFVEDLIREGNRRKADDPGSETR